VRLILGSASPRRRDLLAQIGVVPDEVRAAQIDETPAKNELPHAYVDRMAREKAEAIDATLSAHSRRPGEEEATIPTPSPPRGEGRAAPNSGANDGGGGGEPTLILTADTEVSVGRRILGKPRDEAEAVQFLLLLSGRRHRVTTTVCLKLGGHLWHRRVETRVKVKRLSDMEVSAYIRSGEWRGKAGGYAIQGLAAAFIPEIIGSYTNVVGLPLCETAALLQGAGYPVSFEGAAGCQATHAIS
jgi:septum formation protein